MTAALVAVGATLVTVSSRGGRPRSTRPTEQSAVRVGLKDVKRVLVVALVVVAFFAGIPVLMGMSGAECAECDLGMLLAGACASAVLAANFGFAPPRRAERLRVRRDLFAGRLAASGLYRPPRLA